MSATPSTNSVAALLSSCSVQSYLEAQRRSAADSQQPPLLTLRPDDTVSSALRKLSERGVLSAPVVSAQEKDDIFGGFFGASLVPQSPSIRARM